LASSVNRGNVDTGTAHNNKGYTDSSTRFIVQFDICPLTVDRL
jgi:hypothetical protein